MIDAIPFPNISPEIFSIQIGTFQFALRWYAMSYIVGILIAWWIGARMIRRPDLWPSNRPPMTREQIESLVTWMILGIVLGGRIGYVLFYQPGHYLRNPQEALMVWQGGMSFHGGLMGVVAGVVLFSRRHGVPLGSLADMLAITAAPGLFLGRVANFINAELWGRPTDAPWGVIFPGEAAQDCPGVQGPCARHPSQLYEAALEGLLLFAVVIILAHRGWLKRPFLLAGVFWIGYGAARMFVEMFRQADSQYITPDNPWGHVIRLGEAGLTMGQVLSLPVVAVGIVFVLLSRRRA